MAIDENFPLALSTGTILAGQYIIQKVLGQGGFGITYLAEDHKTGQKVAVKEFFPDTLAYREGTTVISYPGDRTENYDYGKENFLQEAQTLAQFIGNDNIVRIHNYFEENGTAYFVMDYINGISFDHYLRQKGGKISVEEAEKILIPIMDALSAVHSKGIIHRDVTPDNIYICADGTVKLLDFGAARYSLGDKSRSLDVILKHGFAPKEQYTRRGKQGPFTDIYSLAATFYFAITGKRPPDSVDRLDEDDLIPPSSLGIPITDYQEKALYQALAVQPYDRFQSMETFKNVLLNEKNLTSPSASPSQPAAQSSAAASQPAPQTTVTSFSAAQTVPQTSAAYPTSQTMPQTSAAYPTSQTMPQTSAAYPTSQTMPQTSAAYPTSQTMPQTSAAYPTSQTIPQTGAAYPTSQTIPRTGAAYPTSQTIPQTGAAYPTSQTMPQTAPQPAAPYAVPQSGMPAAYPQKQSGGTNTKLIAGIAAAAAAVVVIIGVVIAVAVASNNSNNIQVMNSEPASSSGHGGFVVESEPSNDTTSLPVTISLPDVSVPVSSTEESSEPESSAAQSSAQESSQPIYDSATTSVSSDISRNIVNDGLIAWDGQYQICVDDGGHSLWYVGSDHNTKKLFTNESNYFSNLFCIDGILYFTYGNTAYYMDYKNESSYHAISALQAYAGDTYTFYVTDKYYFVYYHESSGVGYVYRINKNTGAKEDTLSVDYWNEFVIVDNWIYYITEDNSDRSAVARVSASDFSKGGTNYIYDANGGTYWSIVSDGYYMYAMARETDGTWSLAKVALDLNPDTYTPVVWDLGSNIITSTEYVLALNIEGSNAFVGLRDKEEETSSIILLTLNSNGTCKSTLVDDSNATSPNIVPYTDGSYTLNYLRDKTDGTNKLWEISFDKYGNVSSN